MKHRAAVIGAVLVVLLAGSTAVVAAMVSNDNDWSDRGMMSAPWHNRRSPDWQQGGSWSGWLTPDMMTRIPVGGEYGYLARMVVHHEEAIAAAKQLQRSDRTEMREFGESIVASQSAQVAQMRQWLEDWYPNQSGRVPYEPMMRQLAGLTGEGLDRVFLQDMIGHHMVALMMSQQLLMWSSAEHPQVKALATGIRDEQHAEIFRMQQWLRDWFGQGWRHGGMYGGMHGGWMGPDMMDW